jgi:hypothetical protein
MPSARIRLEIDPVTSKRTVVITYESDADALPHEHEEAHRALVKKLFEGGLAKTGDTIRVEREGEGEAAEASRAEEAAAPEGLKQGS